MKKAQLPLDEEVRLAELESYRIMDTPSEKEFDELAELLKEITHCNQVAISFIDKDRQWIKSGIGLPVSEVARDISICAHTILEKEILLVEDARIDDRFHDNPFVTSGVVNFYVGSPIVSGNGHNIGTVCVFDSNAHVFTDQQLRAIDIISSQVTKMLELRMKNRIIMEKADELIDIERKTLQLTLQEQEEERQAIGFELHENFAQVLAACMMYLNMAQESADLGLTFVQKSKDELGSLLKEIRKLSRTYNPISLQAVSLEEIIKDFILEYNVNNSVRLKLDWKGDHEDISPDAALNLFRIIVQYVRMLSGRADVTNAVIRIVVRDEIGISIHSDGDPEVIDLAEQKIAINAILSRIELYDGSYDLKITNGNNTVFRVMLPLARKRA